MYCNKCGKEIPEGQTVCPHCGASQTVQQPYYSQPQQQIVVTSPVTESNGSATAGFVLSIIGLFFSIAFILQLLGFILSIVGIIKAGSVHGKGRGMAIAGLVLSLLGFVPGILLISMMASACASLAVV